MRIRQSEGRSGSMFDATSERDFEAAAGKAMNGLMLAAQAAGVARAEMEPGSR